MVFREQKVQEIAHFRDFPELVCRLCRYSLGMRGNGMKKIRTVLIVEDAEDDAFLLKRALSKSTFTGEHVHIVANGKEAQDYLEGIGDYEDRQRYPIPDIIFTDLKMPIMNGFELLKWLKENPVFQVIPTVVLTSSNDKLDVRRAFFEGANCYFMKPGSHEDSVSALSLIFDFWECNELPSI